MSVERRAAVGSAATLKSRDRRRHVARTDVDRKPTPSRAAAPPPPGDRSHGRVDGSPPAGRADRHRPSESHRSRSRRCVSSSSSAAAGRCVGFQRAVLEVPAELTSSIGACENADSRVIARRAMEPATWLAGSPSLAVVVWEVVLDFELDLARGRVQNRVAHARESSAASTVDWTAGSARSSSRWQLPYVSVNSTRAARASFRHVLRQVGLDAAALAVGPGRAARVGAVGRHRLDGDHLSSERTACG